MKRIFKKALKSKKAQSSIHGPGPATSTTIASASVSHGIQPRPSSIDRYRADRSDSRSLCLGFRFRDQ